MSDIYSADSAWCQGCDATDRQTDRQQTGQPSPVLPACLSYFFPTYLGLSTSPTAVLATVGRLLVHLQIVVCHGGPLAALMVLWIRNTTTPSTIVVVVVVVVVVAVAAAVEYRRASLTYSTWCCCEGRSICGIISTMPYFGIIFDSTTTTQASRTNVCCSDTGRQMEFETIASGVTGEGARGTRGKLLSWQVHEVGITLLQGLSVDKSTK